MKFRELTHSSELDKLDKVSETGTVIIFKHSTRCPISSMAYSRLAEGWDFENNNVPIYYIDVVRHRDVSNQVSSHYGIQHESPQVLVISHGQCVYDNSHHGITADDLKENALNA